MHRLADSLSHLLTLHHHVALGERLAELTRASHSFGVLKLAIFGTHAVQCRELTLVVQARSRVGPRQIYLTLIKAFLLLYLRSHFLLGQGIPELLVLLALPLQVLNKYILLLNL